MGHTVVVGFVAFPPKQSLDGAPGTWNRRKQQILRLTTPKLKKTFGAPFAQDDTRNEVDWMGHAVVVAFPPMRKGAHGWGTRRG